MKLNQGILRLNIRGKKSEHRGLLDYGTLFPEDVVEAPLPVPSN